MGKSKASLFLDIYDVVRLIPEGRVSTYGAIAEYLGAKSGARMVGWAMNNAGQYPDVPAHRVVNRVGILTGKHHFGGDRMQRLLESEGLTIIDDQIQNFEQYLWEPKRELGFD